MVCWEEMYKNGSCTYGSNLWNILWQLLELFHLQESIDLQTYTQLQKPTVLLNGKN